MEGKIQSAGEPSPRSGSVQLEINNSEPVDSDTIMTGLEGFNEM